MRSLVKLLVYNKGIRSTPSIYISILLAYLEKYNWAEARQIAKIISSLEMEPEEIGAFNYLSPIVMSEDKAKVDKLLQYLKA